MKGNRINQLIVLMNGVRVGEYRVASNGVNEFQYFDEWVNKTGARPISLSLPLTTLIYSDDTVVNYFDNLLPDNLQIRDRIVGRFQIKSRRTFDILQAIGRDCVGAVQLADEDIPEDEIENIDFDLLDDSGVASELRGAISANPLGQGGVDDGDFRISIAGAQEKTGLLLSTGGWARPKGSTPTTHIFKLPLGVIEHGEGNIDLTHSIENEWLCLKLAACFNLPAADVDMGEFEEMKALIVARFDRKMSEDGQWIIRLPQEDMCQVHGLPSSLKYQSNGGPSITECMKVLEQSVDNQEDRMMFMKYQLFQVLLAAPDAHGKNYSIRLLPDNRIQLTPLYDVISAYPMLGPGLPRQKLKMAMALRGTSGTQYSWLRILPRHFYLTLKECGYRAGPLNEAYEALRAMCLEVDSVIAEARAGLPEGFPEEVSEPIFVGMKAKADRFIENWDKTD